MFITYTRDPEKVKEKGTEYPLPSVSTTIYCGKDAVVNFSDGVLTIKGTDIDYNIDCVDSFSVDYWGLRV